MRISARIGWYWRFAATGSSPESRPEGRGQASSFLAICVALALAGIFFWAFHLAWPLVFPPPWSDEAWFLIPASGFAETWTPSADRMLVPEGIFWLPAGMYLIDGTIFALIGTDNIRLARAVSFLEIAVAGVVIWQISIGCLYGLPNASAKATWLALAWFACLPIVIAANLARPEALVLLLSFTSILCLLRGRIWGGAALALLAFLTHPLLAIPAMGIAGYKLLFDRGATRPKGWEWPLAAVAAAMFAYEAARLFDGREAYFDQWAFQLERKAGRDLTIETVMFSALLAMSSLYAVLRKVRGCSAIAQYEHINDDSILLLLFGLACLTVHFYGQEMWYWPFAITGSLFLGLAAVPLLSKVRLLASMARQTALFAVVAALSLSTWALALRERGFMHFIARPNVLQTLAVQRAAVISDVHKHLVQIGAAKVLVSPFVYEDLHDLSGGVAIYTVNPFSRDDGSHFDAYVQVSRNFPFHLSERDGLPAVLANHRCERVSRFASAGGIYEVSVVSLTSVNDQKTKGINGAP
jgi:hypothetical protein